MNYRAKLIKLFTFLGGIYFFLEFMLPAEIAGRRIDAYHDQISRGFIVIGAMAIGLGLINLLRVHGTKIVFGRTGALNSAALLGALVLMIIMAALDWRGNQGVSQGARDWSNLADFSLAIRRDLTAARADVPAPELRRAALISAVTARLAQLDYSQAPELEDLGGAATASLAELQREAADVELDRYQLLAETLSAVAVKQREIRQQHYEETLINKLYLVLYTGLFVPLGSAMFSLLGFFIATAAYRAFRVRSFESGLMMSAAVLVMLGQIPFGIWVWEGLPALRMWLLEVPSTAAFRAIEIGASVAGLVIAFRMWLSIESESFSEKRVGGS